MSKNDIFFNYIITVHNKEFLIGDVILNVINVAGPNSCIYPVLDGCSDRSEFIVDDIIQTYPQVKIIKLFADDVHELKSINIGLNAAVQDGRGYNIILQDDVILLDTDWEKKCINLYNIFDRLGIVSFRHGGNISRDLIQDKYVLNPLIDYVQSECGHYPNPDSTLNIGFFVFKEVVIKSPICIPFQIIRDIGCPEEVYAPWDDTAYCYKVSESGYSNGVYALEFISEVSWGTTRNKAQKMDVEIVQFKNLEIFRGRNPTLSPIDKTRYNNVKYLVE